jgi:ATP-dependent 26S proteasome regulatory subunit
MIDLRPYLLAGYPAVALETAEERRLIQHILSQITSDIPVWQIAAAGGLVALKNTGAADPSCAYAAAFQRAAKTTCILVVLDWHHVCRSPSGYRPLLASWQGIKAKQSCVLLIAPRWELPPELQHSIPVLQVPLPGREELAQLLEKVRSPEGEPVVLEEETRQAILDAASGLTVEEAENAVALSMVRSQFTRPDPAQIEAEKIRLVRATCGLEMARGLSLDQVGGYGHLKRWVREEVIPHRRDPVLRVRAALLVGPPGTGKSMACRAVGGALGMPVIRLDLAACRGQYVGQTESAVRTALQVADAVAPCVLWCDEIDSALGGHASSAHTDGGVTLGVLSLLLTWLQEHESEVLFLGTANYPERIPPAFLRPGRLDAIWALDLPCLSERAEIARIHLERTGCAIDGHPQQIAQLTPDYSGAEIAAVVLTAARRTRRQFTAQALEEAVQRITPLARSRAEELEKMRQWARAYAQPAGGEEEDTDAPKGRQVRREV